MISNCGHDENNRYRGGKAGDQTGTEWRVINWYNRPWKCVLRHPNADVRAMIASMAKAAANNNLIGYDQSQRGTFWTNLADSNYDPAQITVACEADCSSGVAAIVKGAGYRLGIDALKKVSTACYTGNLRAALKAAGFEVLTESKYLTSDAYLFAGDILLNDNAHVATNLTTGSKASGTSAPSKSINEVAKEVINGKWGNGSDRTNRLAAAGYDAKAVQNEVNRILKGNATTPSKSINEVAKEVINGKWGNGSDRTNRLAAAGYDAKAVQNEVNRILKGNATTPSKSINEVAKEVINGKWGNGSDRTNRLAAAGYDAKAVQNEVNRILR
ncbi:hypothetical protein [Mediterraneibacter gnavus]|nr:hypothetical protein [Mediterraneibacter gnavus]